MQVFCSRKWLYILEHRANALEKYDLQSIVQSAAEFHDRNLPEIEHVLFVQVSGASFLYQKMAPETPFTPASFLSQETCDRNLRQKLASLNAALGLTHSHSVFNYIHCGSDLIKTFKIINGKYNIKLVIF